MELGTWALLTAFLLFSSIAFSSIQVFAQGSTAYPFTIESISTFDSKHALTIGEMQALQPSTIAINLKATGASAPPNFTIIVEIIAFDGSTAKVFVQDR